MALLLWTLLCGPCFVEPALWTVLCGPCFVEPPLWTLLCGPCFVDPALRTLLCGHCSVDPASWTLLCGPCFVDMNTKFKKIESLNSGLHLLGLHRTRVVGPSKNNKFENLDLKKRFLLLTCTVHHTRNYVIVFVF